MPEIERNTDKNSTNLETQAKSTALETQAKPSENKPAGSNPEKKENTPGGAPQKSAWDLPDGEFSEVIDSEGHRNRINHY